MSVIHGDCLEVMAGMEPETFDAIVTDPPYGLEFMGKAWDKLWSGGTGDWKDRPKGGKSPFQGARGPTYQAGPPMQAWHQQWAEAAYRVAKPSAYLLAFGGTRTVHRMTVALEDAGWIIRDMLVWAYASGFPKSKASLKPAWEPIVMARKPGPLRMLAIDECRIEPDASSLRVRHNGSETGDIEQWRTGARASDTGGNPAGRWPANVILTDPVFDGGIEGVVGGGEQTSRGPAVNNANSEWSFTSYPGSPEGADLIGYGDSGTYSRFFQLPRGASCDWCGARLAAPSSSPSSGADGSAPDPVAIVASHDSGITMDSLTISGTASQSLSDDAANTPRTPRNKRPGTLPESGRPSSRVKSPAASDQAIDITTTMGVLSTCVTCAEAITSATTSPSPEARNYPWAYLIPKADRADREPVLGGLPMRDDDVNGSFGLDAARPHTKPDYRYERKPRANVHPTVKPVDLMRHLVRLVTPTGGHVLDPFLGSGTTAIAAEMEGFAWTGIEREAEYVAIAEARLNGTQRGLGLETA